MSLFNLLTRTVETAVKLPVAAAWDVISLGNMGEGTSTGKVLREHEARKRLDEYKEISEAVRQIRGDK